MRVPAASSGRIRSRTVGRPDALVFSTLTAHGRFAAGADNVQPAKNKALLIPLQGKQRVPCRGTRPLSTLFKRNLVAPTQNRRRLHWITRASREQVMFMRSAKRPTR